MTESFPLQYNLAVISGLSNACVSYGGYYLHIVNLRRLTAMDWLTEEKTPKDEICLCTGHSGNSGNVNLNFP